MLHCQMQQATQYNSHHRLPSDSTSSSPLDKGRIISPGANEENIELNDHEKRTPANDSGDESDYDHPWDDLDSAVKRASVDD